ncbi:hypothetical protein [Bacillus sp. NEB1478]|uniref:hypothetical protein n=1 Tax=Bacillus sp. NEB1478 TaxID=3073816 RepID=UPI002873B042|nr:hypothetical protein [Bacillus sp. NEB1478]WNB91308.1 hypothetical protein RGB74_15585 [Bacillus sp. NEB1478]
MSYEVYHMCRRYIGRSVLITCTDGKKYHGILKHVDDHKVYILPYRDGIYEDDRFFVPALIGLTLGAIAGFALAPRPYPVYPPLPYPGYGPYPY